MRAIIRGSILSLMLILGGCAGTPEPAWVHYATAMRMGDHAMSEANTGLAIALYERAVELDRERPEARIALASAFEASGDYEQALKQYDEVLRVWPAHVEALRGTGLVFLALDEPEVAAQYLQRAVNEDPVDFASQIGLGLSLDYQARHDEAQGVYRQALALRPSSSGGRINLAISLALSGQFDAALAALQPAFSTSTAHGQVALNKALILGLAGQEEAARAVSLPHLSADEVENNLQQYAWLRTLPDLERARAIMQFSLHGP